MPVATAGPASAIIAAVVAASNKVTDMDIFIIENSARKLRELEKALRWMQEHGRQALDPIDKNSFSVIVTLNMHSASEGAREAQEQLSICARLQGPTILRETIIDVANTIEILRQRIIEETRKP
jgi:hypothetical protein